MRELPVRLERMIHFVPPHLDKLRAKVPELARQVDVVLGNLEDAIPIEAKQAARAGFIEMAKAVDFGPTGLWTRINALNSPWALDDVTEIVAAIGDKLDVIMLPKVDGPWDIHYLDQLLAQLEARHKTKKPILIHAILETAQGVNNVEAIAGASPRMHGMSLGPADLAASRAMKTTRVGGGHPDYKGRPLTGIWATPPYLHNGSVPTLYDLLLPPDQRPASFSLGTREFDPVKVGYVTEPTADNRPLWPDEIFVFRARDDSGNPIAGNANMGHDYGNAALQPEDRMAVIEYMKAIGGHREGSKIVP